jgi:hypothetical protein
MEDLMRACSLILILAVTAAIRLSAQWPAGVTSGARVQVRLPELQYQLAGPRGQLLRGRINGLSADTLYLSVTDSLGPLPIPRRMIDRLQLSKGVPSRLNNALRGGLIAGIGTALLSVGLNELHDEPDNDTSAGTAALVGGAVGFAVGGITGAIWPAERWKRVRLPADD